MSHLCLERSRDQQLDDNGGGGGVFGLVLVEFATKGYKYRLTPTANMVF